MRRQRLRRTDDDVDRISPLPDEILLKVLSFLPTTEDVMSTMVLSKRWKFLWKMVPKLRFDNDRQKVGYGRFSRFIDRSLFLNEAPVLETLHINFGKHYCNTSKYGTDLGGDISVWITAAARRNVRELIIEIHSEDESESVALPRIFYTSYKTLVSLKLSNAILVNDSTSPISFPSLKSLSLVYMKYPSDEFLNNLISNCPVLEDLVVELCEDDNVKVLSVRACRLQSLVLRTDDDREVDEDDIHGFVINAPCLKCLMIVDHHDVEGFCVIESDTSKIVKAKVDVTYNHTEDLLRSVASAKRLSLCLPLPTSTVYPIDVVFNHLITLELCTCETKWLYLLMCLLRDSPNLQSLKLELSHVHDDKNKKSCPSLDDLPCSVPECLLTSLTTLEWKHYVGTEVERGVMDFFLRNGICLRKVTIKPQSTLGSRKKLEMVTELTYLPRGSPTCVLAFDLRCNSSYNE